MVFHLNENISELKNRYYIYENKEEVLKSLEEEYSRPFRSGGDVALQFSGKSDSQDTIKADLYFTKKDLEDSEKYCYEFIDEYIKYLKYKIKSTSDIKEYAFSEEFASYFDNDITPKEVLKCFDVKIIDEELIFKNIFFRLHKTKSEIGNFYSDLWSGGGSYGFEKSIKSNRRSIYETRNSFFGKITSAIEYMKDRTWSLEKTWIILSFLLGFKDKKDFSEQISFYYKNFKKYLMKRSKSSSRDYHDITASDWAIKSKAVFSSWASSNSGFNIDFEALKKAVYSLKEQQKISINIKNEDLKEIVHENHHNFLGSKKHRKKTLKIQEI